MNMKLNDILVLNETLKAVIDKDLKMDALLKFRLLGIMKHLESPVANFNIVRDGKIREYGKQDVDGNVSINQDDTETMEKFTNDITKILESDVDVNFKKIKAVDIFDAGIPSEYLIKLYPILEEPMEDVKNGGNIRKS